MSRQHGKTIYEGLSGNMRVTIVDHGTTRSLYFSETILQSRMLLSDPHQLILYYPQYMVSALLLQPSPVNILVIGIGAGSLLHFFSHYFPNCNIDGVDNSQLILDLARGYFRLREYNNLSVHCQDGFDFLSQIAGTRKYDIICIDAYDAIGMAKKIYSREFFTLCRDSLAENGTVSLNLWSGNITLLKKVKKDLHHVFKSLLLVPVKKRENIVALAMKQEIPWDKIDRSRNDLTHLSRHYGIDLQEIAATIIKHNMKIGHRIAAWLK